VGVPFFINKNGITNAEIFCNFAVNIMSYLLPSKSTKVYK